MMKTKISTEEYYCAQDRLSELPDLLIFHIFKSLPTTDVVRTTLLSKRWVNLWTTITCLDFKDSTMRDRDKFRDFINGALNSWRGTKISSFSVEFGDDLWNSVTHDDIDSWVLLATKKSVEILKLYLPIPHNQKSYLVPDYLYSCSSLKDLQLRCCDLRIEDGNNMVKWDQLELLMINGKCPSDDAIDQVLCGSPKLEFLFFVLYHKDNGSLSIRSSSLKRLTVVTSQSMIDLELRIWTPNLQQLSMWGFPCSKCLMMNVSASLTEAYFILFDQNHGRTVAQILPPFQHVERAYLTDWCIKVLGAMKEKSMPSPFPNANFLELTCFTQEYEEILGVLEMFPRLRNLVIGTNSKIPRPEHEESRLKFDRNNFPNLFLLHLRTVDVTWSKGDDSIFPLIDFLLKYARNLEKMVFWENGDEPRKLLLKMERSSLTAEFIFDRAKLYL